jgi:hypothetical protein
MDTKVSFLISEQNSNENTSIKYDKIYKTLDENINLAFKNIIHNDNNSTIENHTENMLIDKKLSPSKKSQKCSQYICDPCNYTTKIKSNYKKHLLSSIHKKIAKISLNHPYFCKICDYSTKRKNDYDKHMNTKKHIEKENNYSNITSKNKSLLQECLKNNENNIININTLKEDITSIIVKEFKNMSEQNKLLIDIANKQNATNITNNNNINKINNQHFNLNVFLNETCKDAMNLSEFLENMQVSMEDMEKTGELGFAKGMSRIIMNNLNAIDVYKRPIHCSDVKRETLYIKNNGVWEKETEERKHTKEIIYKVSCLNTKQLLKWRDLARNKGYDNSEHSKNDEFMKLVMEVNKLRDEEIDKVITNISKHVAIDKEKVKMSGYLN